MKSLLLEGAGAKRNLGWVQILIDIWAKELICKLLKDCAVWLSAYEYDYSSGKCICYSTVYTLYGMCVFKIHAMPKWSLTKSACVYTLTRIHSLPSLWALNWVQSCQIWWCTARACPSVVLRQPVRDLLAWCPLSLRTRRSNSSKTQVRWTEKSYATFSLNFTYTKSTEPLQMWQVQDR